MTHMWWLWLKNRWRGTSMLAIAVLAVLVMLIMATGQPGFQLRLLGNAMAPRAERASDTGVTLPRSTDPDTSIPPAADANGQGSVLDQAPSPANRPDTVAAAQAGWSTEERTQHENEVLAAITCARQQRNAAVLTVDPTLTEAAGQAWLLLVRDPAWSLMDLSGNYTLRSVLTLDLSSPVRASTADSVTPQDQSEPSCSVGGFDAATLPGIGEGHAIGVAVFPPQASWDAASAVVLIK